MCKENEPISDELIELMIMLSQPTYWSEHNAKIVNPNGWTYNGLTRS